MEIEDIHPLESGLIRRKVRRDRRPGLPIEIAAALLSPISRAKFVAKHVKFGAHVPEDAPGRAGDPRDPMSATTWTRR